MNIDGGTEDVLLAPEKLLKEIQRLCVVTDEDDLVGCLRSDAM